MATKAKTASDNFDFEASLTELNRLVEQMEQGGLSLEESLKSFERGIALARACQGALKTAEQRVQVLMEQNGQSNLVPFNVQSDD